VGLGLPSRLEKGLQCELYESYGSGNPNPNTTVTLSPNSNPIVTLTLTLIRLIVNRFTSSSRMFHLYGDVIITGEGLQTLTLENYLSAAKYNIFFTYVPYIYQTNGCVTRVKFTKDWAEV
jgi:hypothetical protein